MGTHAFLDIGIVPGRRLGHHLILTLFIFMATCIYFYHYLSDIYLVHNGGLYSRDVSKDVTHLIASPRAWKRKSALGQCRAEKLPITIDIDS